MAKVGAFVLYVIENRDIYEGTRPGPVTVPLLDRAASISFQLCHS